MEPKVTILALTLNEIDGVKAILPKIDPSWYDQLIVVDGGSTDGTTRWCVENGYEVCFQQTPGVRHAYFDVWPLVRGDIVVTLSPDGNCDPKHIPALVKSVKLGADLAIGSRYCAGAKSDDDDIITAFGNRLFTKTVNFLHRGVFTDAMVIYRAFPWRLPMVLGLFNEDAYTLPERMFGTVISWEPLMSVRAAKMGLFVHDIAAGEPARIGGTRKLQILRWGAAYYFQFIRELWFWRKS